jgi:hypothetical protein
MRDGPGCGISARGASSWLRRRRARSSRCGICSICGWRAVLDSAQQPFKSETWIAAVTVVLERDGGDLARTRRLGWTRFETAVRTHHKQGGQKPFLRIARRIFAALADPAGCSGAPGRRPCKASPCCGGAGPRARPPGRHRGSDANHARYWAIGANPPSGIGEPLPDGPGRDGRTLCGRRQGGSLACSTAAPHGCGTPGNASAPAGPTTAGRPAADR